MSLFHLNRHLRSFLFYESIKRYMYEKWKDIRMHIHTFSGNHITLGSHGSVNMNKSD